MLSVSCIAVHNFGLCETAIFFFLIFNIRTLESLTLFCVTQTLCDRYLRY